MRIRRIVPVTILLCACFAGCQGTEKKAPPLTADQRTAKSKLEEQMNEAAKTAKTYHAMDNTELLGRLVEQSKALKEPFNSLAYRELKTRTDIDAKALAGLVRENQNVGGLLPLLLLRNQNKQAYTEVPIEMRARVLTDALQVSKTFNTWGLPGVYLQDASNAMIETGRSAVPGLKRILSEMRPAPLYGSKEHVLAQQRKYRLCDYALFFLEQIAGKQDFRIPESTAERDALIKQVGAAK
jgi:hypothetical protein